MSIGNSTPIQGRGIRLRTRIVLAFVFMITSIAVSIVSGAIGFRRMERGFEQHSRVGAFARRIADIDRDVVELQAHVQEFTQTGSQHLPDSIRRLGARLQSDLATAIDSADDPRVRERLATMQNLVARYLKDFESVVKERRLRQEIIQSRILKPARSITEILEPIAAGCVEHEKIPGTRAQQALTQITMAQVSALRFLSQPEALLVRKTLKNLKAARSFLQPQPGDARPPADTDAAKLVALVDRFHKGFLRAVQATRGYRYFVNVVMAGNAAEFLHQSKLLRAGSVQSLQAIEKETASNSQQAKNFMLLVSGSAVVLGLIVSIHLIRSLVGPITSITETFRTLGSGDDVEVVPGLARNDEIGDMARAADVFRDRNRQTRDLLAESQRMTLELDAKAEQLERSNRDLDSFAYVASHDLRSPLRAIDNLAEWIAEDADDVLPDESREHFGLLRKRVGRMEQLLADLLEYSRAGRVDSAKETFRVDCLIQEIQETIEWPDDMQLVIDCELPAIETERGPLARVLQNLMTNAVKYRRDDSPRLTISARRLDDLVEFSVADNGPGIEPQYHSQIFEMFKRLHNQDEIEGSGMGLALIKRLIESFGGTIAVQSQAGQGATFRFTWKPVRIGAAARSRLESQPVSAG